MAFTQKRGRPKSARPSIDLGTPELQLKRAFELTDEPLDLCLRRGLISHAQHRAGLHLRWLYTIRYGAPVLTTTYEEISSQCSTNAQDEAWRKFREKEYTEAVTLLKHAGLYESVMRICIYHDIPVFLNQRILRKSWENDLLINQIDNAKTRFLHGLDLIKSLWRISNG